MPPSSYRKIAKGVSTDEGFGQKPFEATITSVNSQDESIAYDSSIGPSNARIPHPMLGPNAWIRGIPEKGARIIVATTAATERRAALSYYSRVTSEYIKNYNNDIGVYKPLNDGEWDMMTAGLAYVYGTRRGKLFLRGGPIQQEMDPKKMRLRTRAPTYQRELHTHIDSEMNDQERFGIVMRHFDEKQRDCWIRIPFEGNTNDTDYKGNAKTKSFTKEYLRKFSRDGVNLIDFRQGDVVDDKGAMIPHTKTGYDLRHRVQYFNKDGSDKVNHEIDVYGNMFTKTPGEYVELDAKTAELIAKLKKLSGTISDSISIKADSAIEIRSDTNARISGSKQTILGPSPTAVDPVIKGRYFLASVIKPLLKLISTHFINAGGPSGPVDFITYKPYMIALGTAVEVLIPLLEAALSTNVKTS